MVSCAQHASEIMAHRVKDEGEGMRAYRAPSLYQPHRARQALKDAFAGKIKPLSGLYLGLSNISTARFIAPLGFDMVWIDWEHSSCNLETMTTMVHEIAFMSEGKSIPFVRVPGHDHAAIGYALDAGASIIVPQVDTVEQAQHIVSAAKFGKKRNGTRSVPPFRLIPGVTDIVSDPKKYVDVWQAVNEQAAIMIQIESLEGLNNLDAILTACPDIDAVWFGTIDTRVSMGLPGNGGFGGMEPEFVEAWTKYMEVTGKHKVARGGFALGNDELFDYHSASLQLVVCASEILTLTTLKIDLERSRKRMAHRVKQTLPSSPFGNGRRT